MATKEELEKKIDKFEVNMTRTDRIVNGTENEDVRVDDGQLVPSIRKWQKELEEEYAVPPQDLIDAVNQSKANATSAEESAQQAVTAAGQVEQDAERIAQEAAAQAVQDVVAGVDGQVAVAQSAADRAEAARDAAFVNANVYATVAEGIAAVEVDEQFQTLSEDGLEYVRYRKDSESVATEVARNLSPAGVREEAHSAVEKLGIYVTREDLIGEYRNASLTGGSSIGGYYSTSSADTRSVIYKARPGVRYTVAKTPSNRFRVAEFDAAPTDGKAASFYIKDEFVPEELDGTTEYFTFTTQQDTSFVVVYVSTNGTTPDVAMYLGEYQGLEEEAEVVNTKPTVFENRVAFSQPLTAPNIVKGKNLFLPTVFPRGVLIFGGIANPVVPLTVSTTTPNAVTAYCEIEPGETYTVSKTASDRFRVALSSSEPAVGRTVRIIAGIENDDSQSFTFDSGDNRYLILYLSTTGSMPEFVQLEKGSEATPFETAGYKFHPMAENPLAKAINLYSQAGVGDANYISKAAGTEGAWANSTFTIPASDDTEELQEAFDKANGIVSLDPGKKYRITSTIVADIAKAKTIQGNMATIVVDGDFEAIHWKGTLTGTANAGPLNRGLAYNQMSPLITGLRITSPMEVTGTGIVIEGCMSPIVFGCSLKYLRRGIVLRGRNRNLIIGMSNIYACSDYGIHFEEGGDLHQVIIANNNISYCRKNIYSENQSLYNVQIIGNDIETSSYPSIAECNIEFLQTATILEDLKIVGNTIEDHFNTNALIKLNGAAGNIRHVAISGNVIGNSNDVAIQMGGVQGVDISGEFKMNKGYAIDLIGHAYGLRIGIQSGGGYGGGLLRAVGDFYINGLSTVGSVCARGVRQPPVYIDVDVINFSSISNLTLEATTLEQNEDGSLPAPIFIRSRVMRLLRADSNTISTALPLEKAIEIICTGTSVKGSMRGNMATAGTFTAPETFMVGDNM